MSVAWYFYVQLYYILPDEFGKRLATEISKRIYEGVISGVSADDIFVYDNTDPRYKVYMNPQRTETSIKIRFAVILTKAPPPDWSVQSELAGPLLVPGCTRSTGQRYRAHPFKVLSNHGVYKFAVCPQRPWRRAAV